MSTRFGINKLSIFLFLLIVLFIFNLSYVLAGGDDDIDGPETIDLDTYEVIPGDSASLEAFFDALRLAYPDIFPPESSMGGITGVDSDNHRTLLTDGGSITLPESTSDLEVTLDIRSDGITVTSPDGSTKEYSPDSHLNFDNDNIEVESSLEAEVSNPAAIDIPQTDFFFEKMIEGYFSQDSYFTVSHSDRTVVKTTVTDPDGNKIITETTIINGDNITYSDGKLYVESADTIRYDDAIISHPEMFETDFIEFFVEYAKLVYQEGLMVNDVINTTFLLSSDKAVIIPEGTKLNISDSEDIKFIYTPLTDIEYAEDLLNIKVSEISELYPSSDYVQSTISLEQNKDDTLVLDYLLGNIIILKTDSFASSFDAVESFIQRAGFEAVLVTDADFLALGNIILEEKQVPPDLVNLAKRVVEFSSDGNKARLVLPLREDAIDDIIKRLDYDMPSIIISSVGLIPIGDSQNMPIPDELKSSITSIARIRNTQKDSAAIFELPASNFEDVQEIIRDTYDPYLEDIKANNIILLDSQHIESDMQSAPLPAELSSLVAEIFLPIEDPDSSLIFVLRQIVTDLESAASTIEYLISVGGSLELTALFGYPGLVTDATDFWGLHLETINVPIELSFLVDKIYKVGQPEFTTFLVVASDEANYNPYAVENIISSGTSLAIADVKDLPVLFLDSKDLELTFATKLDIPELSTYDVYRVTAPSYAPLSIFQIREDNPSQYLPIVMANMTSQEFGAYISTDANNIDYSDDLLLSSQIFQANVSGQLLQFFPPYFDSESFNIVVSKTDILASREPILDQIKNTESLSYLQSALIASPGNYIALGSSSVISSFIPDELGELADQIYTFNPGAAKQNCVIIIPDSSLDFNLAKTEIRTQIVQSGIFDDTYITVTDAFSLSAVDSQLRELPIPQELEGLASEIFVLDGAVIAEQKNVIVARGGRTGYFDVLDNIYDDSYSVLQSKLIYDFNAKTYTSELGTINISSDIRSESIISIGEATFGADSQLGFVCMLLDPTSVYIDDNDGDIRKHYALRNPIYGNQFSLCIRKSSTQNFNTNCLDCGVVDFVSRKNLFNGIIDYLRYPIKDGELSSLELREFYYSLLSSNATMNLNEGMIEIPLMTLGFNDYFNTISNTLPDRYSSIIESPVSENVHTLLRIRPEILDPEDNLIQRYNEIIIVNNLLSHNQVRVLPPFHPMIDDLV